jgi:hypothetical protein
VFGDLLLSETLVHVFPCDERDFESARRQELLEHIESFHSENSEETKETPEEGLFWCDICPLYFESDLTLQFHKRGCHWDHWDKFYR